MQKACECESARPERGDSGLNRFQDPARAFQNPDSAPRPAIWNLKDKLRMSDSETALSVYAPAHLQNQLPPVFLNSYPGAFSDFPTYDRRAKQEAQSQVSTDPFASFGTE
jgi:hypothetical protein